MSVDALLPALARWVAISLVHVSWISIVVVVLLALLLTAMPRAGSVLRYRLSMTALLSIGLSMPVVLVSVMSQYPVVAQRAAMPDDRGMHMRSFLSGADAPPVLVREDAPPDASAAPRTISDARENEQRSRRATPPSVEASEAHWFHRASPMVAGTYAVGFLVMLARLLFGMWATRSYHRSSTRISDPKVLVRFRALVSKSGVGRLPGLASCCRVNTPVVIGCFRPVILLPPSLLSGLSPAEMDAVLAHELAHIWRRDHCWIVVQRVIEAFLFFHPAIWYLSRKIHAERERCCDDRVIHAGFDRLVYARSLLRVAELAPKQGLGTGAYAFPAADGGRPSRLRERIERLFDTEPTSASSVSRMALVASLAAVLGFLLIGCGALAIQANAEGREPGTLQAADDQADEDGATLNDEDEGTDSFGITTRPGRWQLAGGVQMEIVTEALDERNRRTTATLLYPEDGDRPRSIHRMHIAYDRDGVAERWIVAWDRDDTRVWILSMTPHEGKPYLRYIHYADAKAIWVQTELGVGGRDEEATPSDPDDPLAATRQRPFSIGSPMPPIPEDLIDPFQDHLPDYPGPPRGLYSPLSGHYETSAVTFGQWSVSGQIRDERGEALAGVTVEARLERFPTTVVATSTSDDRGRYRLAFSTDLTTLEEFRGVMIQPVSAGRRDRDLARAGEFTLVLSEDEAIERRFSDRRLLIDAEGRADFVMEPAAVLEGVVVDRNGTPHASAWIAVRTPDHRPGYSSASTVADDRGRFRLEGVPASRTMLLEVALSPTRNAVTRIDTPPGATRRQLQLEFSDESDRPELRVVEGESSRSEAGESVAVGDDLDSGADERESAVSLQDEPPRCRVVDDAGQPIPGARVEVRPYSLEEQPPLAETTTDEDGYFEYPEETPDSGYFYLKVSAEGHVTDRWIGNYRVRIKRDGEWVPDVFTLDRAVTLRGEVIGPDGEPLAGVPLSFDYFNDRVASINNRRFQSDDEGKFEVAGAPRGELFIRYDRSLDSDNVVPGTAAFFVAHVHVDDEAEAEVVVDLSRADCVLEGRLADASGRGVAGAEIRLAYAFSAHRLDHSVHATTDERGRFRVDGLPPDAFVASAGLEGRRIAGDPVTVQLRPGEVASIRMKAYSEGHPPPVERTTEPEWGPAANGLQTAIVLQPDKTTFRIGETVNIGLLVRNVSDEAVEFEDVWGFNRLHLIGPEDEHRSFDFRAFTGIPVAVVYRLEPGHEVELKGTFSIEWSSPRDTGGSRATFKASVVEGASYRLSISRGDGFDQTTDPSAPSSASRSGEVVVSIAAGDGE